MPQYNVCGTYQYKQHGSLTKAFADVDVHAPNVAGAIRIGLAHIRLNLNKHRAEDASTAPHRHLVWSVKPSVMEVIK